MISTVVIFVLAFAPLGLLLGFAEMFDILPGPVEGGNSITVNLEEEISMQDSN